MSVTEQPPVNASTLNPVGRAARAAEAWLRRDWLVIVLLALGTAVMTYPLILRLDGDRPLESNDALVKVWDIWWFGHMLRTGQPAHYTQDMFYPVGLNLTYHSISWTVSALGWLLTPVFGYPGAYKITVLMAAFATAYAGYLLIHSLVKNRAAACLGGAIYSFAPYHIARTSGHPDLAHLAPIPLTVLLLIEALSSESVLVALGAALMLGVTAFTSLYILGFALIDLPMGRPPSKWYMYLQSIHNRPIVEGIAGRTPAGAYRYIEGNPVLAAWRKAGPLPCDPDEYEEALDALLDDGFRYVIVHWRDYVLVHWQTSDSERLEPYFQAEPVYQDSELAAYRLEDLKAASLPESVPCR